MKTGLQKWISICLVCLPLVVAADVRALVRFEASRSMQIDLEKLEISREDFFGFVTTLVHQKPFGLQAYGQVPFSACEITVNGRPLVDYELPNGRKIRFISNPSCAQVVLKRVLDLNYGYRADNLDAYGNRKCIRAVESVFRPLLEYYTIHYEEKSRPDCERCDEKESRRLERINQVRERIVDSCGPEQQRVIRFLSELDQAIEKAFQSKKNPSR